MSKINTVWSNHCHRSTSAPVWFVALFVGMTVSLLPASNLIADTTQAEVTHRDEGFPVPRKGPLVSELRENLDPETPDAETVIRRYEDSRGNVVREFLIHGALFQIEVIPISGPPYYLIDVTGEGLFQARYQGSKPRLLVPQWVFFRF